MTTTSERLIELPLSSFKPNDGVEYEPAFYDGLFTWVIENKILVKVVMFPSDETPKKHTRVCSFKRFELNTRRRRGVSRKEYVDAVHVHYAYLEGEASFIYFPHRAYEYEISLIVPESKLPKQKEPPDFSGGSSPR